jgi:hypothetical protein
MQEFMLIFMAWSRFTPGRLYRGVATPHIVYVGFGLEGCHKCYFSQCFPFRLKRRVNDPLIDFSQACLNKQCIVLQSLYAETGSQSQRYRFKIFRGKKNFLFQ